MPELTETEYDHLFDYVAFSRYPTGSKNQRRIIRRKCNEHFTVKEGLLYYSALGTSKVSELKKTGDYSGRDWKVVVRMAKER